jgi:hypothetical protein
MMHTKVNVLASWTQYVNIIPCNFQLESGTWVIGFHCLSAEFLSPLGTFFTVLYPQKGDNEVIRVTSNHDTNVGVVNVLAGFFVDRISHYLSV